MPSALEVARALSEEGITHVVGIPDNHSAALFDLLADRSQPRLVRVTREGEAFAIAAGLWMGGQRPVVLIQATGLLESGDALRGTLFRMRVPVVSLVTCRGYGLLRKRGLDPALGERARAFEPGPDRSALLLDPGLDAVSLLAEPTVRAWGLPFRYLTQADSADELVAWAHREATGRAVPTILLVTDLLGGSGAH